MQQSRIVIVIAATIALTALVLLADESGISWPQWGQNPQHQGFVGVAGQPIRSQLANVIYDPLVPQEQAFTGGDLLAHYQVPR